MSKGVEKRGKDHCKFRVDHEKGLAETSTHTFFSILFWWTRFISHA